jgi:hypothetical protein
VKCRARRFSLSSPRSRSKSARSGGHPYTVPATSEDATNASANSAIRGYFIVALGSRARARVGRARAGVRRFVFAPPPPPRDATQSRAVLDVTRARAHDDATEARKRARANARPSRVVDATSPTRDAREDADAATLSTPTPDDDAPPCRRRARSRSRSARR